MKKLLVGLFVLISASSQAIEVKSQNFSYTLDDKKQTVVFNADKDSVVFKGEVFKTFSPEEEHGSITIEGENPNDKDRQIYLLIFSKSKKKRDILKKYGANFNFVNKDECENAKAIIAFRIFGTGKMSTTCLQ